MLSKLKNFFFFSVILLLWQSYAHAQCGSVNFTASKTTGCAPFGVTFIGTNIPTGAKVEWDLGGGFVTGTDTAFRIFTVSGKKDIKLKITLSGQTSACTTVVKQNIVDVLPKPEINLWRSDSLLCNGGANVQFIDSTVGVATRQWIYDGTSQSATGVTITKFASVGNHSLNLIVKNSFGCESIYKNNVAVAAYNTINVEICGTLTEFDDETVGNFRGNILNSSLKPDSFRWSFPGASTTSSTSNNPKGITYKSPVGTNAVTMHMIFPGGCKYNFSKSDFVKPFLISNDDSACIKQEIKITNLAADGGRSDFSMSFPGANFKSGDVKEDFKISYVSTGNKDIVYSYKYNPSSQQACETSVRAKDIVVVQGPQARAFSNDKNNCTLDSVFIQSNSLVPSSGQNLYTWRIFDGDSNYIKPSPFGPTRDLSSFKIKFDTFGVYNLSLKVENKRNGCADSVLLENYLRIIPPETDIIFSDTILCADDNLVMEDNTMPQPTPGNPYTYTWLLRHDDSTNVFFSGTGKKFTRRLRMPGKYSVRLITKSNNNCADTLQLNGYVEVRGILAEIFVDSTKGCPGFQTTVSNKINLIYPDTVGAPYWYAWDAFPKAPVDFGDTTLSTTSVKFNDVGCYTLSLDINDVYGCKKKLSSSSICIGNKANFGWDTDTLAQLCLNEELPLVDSSLYSIAEYRWSVDKPGLTFTNPNGRLTNIKFTSAGKYKIKQFVSSGTPAFCVDSIEREIEILAPEAKFKVDKPLTQCAPQQITFTNESKNADSYKWFYGDGGTSINSNTEHLNIYTKNNISGFTPRLIAFKTGSEECADTFDLTSKVRIIGPTPEYNMDTVFGCDTLEVNFFNLTNPLNAEYVFDYGDGSAPDSNKMVKHRYIFNGTNADDSVVFVPTIVASSFGCDAFFTDTLVIYRSPRAKFITDTLEGCKPLTVTLVQNNTLNHRFYWDLWNNNTVDSVNQDTVVWVLDTVGAFGASIVAEIGTCRSEYKLDSAFKVGKAPEALFSISKDRGCDTATVFFKNQTNPIAADFALDFGDGSTPETTKMGGHLYSIPATHPDDSIIYYPTLTANSFGCDNVYRDTVVIYRSPSVSISVDTMIGCQPFDVVFSAAVSNNFGYEWDLYNDGVIDTTNNATWGITLDTFGYFDISVTAEYIGGCITKTVMDSLVRVVDLPVPEFTMSVTEGCDSLEVAFTNQTSPGFTGFTFDYGDGNLVNDSIPNHVYKFSGTDDSVIYYPKIVGTRVLCNAEFADTVVIYKSPTADFVIDTTFGCEPMTFSLLSTSTANSYLEWDVFNDTTLEKINNDTLTFTSDSVGSWPMRLHIEYLGGCTSSKVVNDLFTVYRMPVADFSLDTLAGCDSLEVNFTTNNPIDSFQLNYGNGLTDIDRTEARTFYFPTVSAIDSFAYFPVYTVYNPLLGACQDTQTDTIWIYKSPAANFSIDTTIGCQPTTVTLINTSTPINYWEWDVYNDGIIDSANTDTLSFTTDSVGEWSVRLFTRYVGGCTSTLTIDSLFKVYRTPVPDITFDTIRGCDTLQVNFTTNNAADSFIINYGIGLTDTNFAKTAAYYFPAISKSDSALFNVTYAVYNPDFNACVGQQIDTMYVFRTPKPGFVVDTNRGCAPLTLTFTDTTQRAVKFDWDFNNDGISDDTTKIAETTLGAGKQTIGIKIESIEGCTDTIYKRNVILVNNPPRVDFVASRDYSCANDPIQFRDISVVDTNVAARKWSFGTPVNPDFIVIPTPNVGFPAEGEYLIKLEVTDSNFCSSVDSMTIEIANLDTPQYVNFKTLAPTINTGNTLTWKGSTEADFKTYTLIKVNETDSSQIELSTTNSSDPDSDIEDLAKYYLRVTDTCSNISLVSPPISRLVLRGDNDLENVLRVRWNYLAPNNFSKFRIHRKRPLSSTWFVVDSLDDANAKRYLDSAACDSGYVYKVEGITNYGGSSMSNEIALTASFKQKTTPLEMRKVTVENDEVIKLNWERNTHPGQRKYVIDRAGADKKWTINYDSSFVNQYYDSNANFRNEYYYYRVWVEDYCGNRNPVSNLGTSINLLGNGNNGNISLKWNKYFDWNEEYEFVLQVKFGTGSFKPLAKFDTDGLSYIDDELHSELDTPWCYRIMAVQTTGKTDSVFSNIYCDYLSANIFMPNAFSPNGDGLNDEFEIVGELLKREDLGTYSQFDLKIIDRWGEVLFQSSDPRVSWDGTKGGNLVPFGQYWYMLKLVDSNENETIETGPVFMIR